MRGIGGLGGLLLTLIFAVSAGATGELVVPSHIRIGSESFPGQADYSTQFAPITQVQVGGTCHVFAAAALYEAACKRVTGKIVNVSEAYMTYRHLRWRVNSRVAYFQTYTEDLSRRIFNEEADGGRAEYDLQGLLDGYVMSEKEFPFDLDFVAKTKSLGSQGASYERRYGRFAGQDRFREFATPELDAFVKGLFEKNKVDYFQDLHSARQRYVPKTADPDVRACKGIRMQLRVQHMPTLKNIVAILARGLPVLCSGHYSLRESDYKRTSSHVSTVVGYRYNEKFPRNIEFKFRDSNQNAPSWGWGFEKFSCESLVWLE